MRFDEADGTLNTGIDAFFQSRRTIAISLLLGSGGFLIFGIMPIVLGGLLSSGRLDAAQLGWAATAETLCIAIGMFLGTRMLGPPSSRWIVILGGIIMAAANLLTLIVVDPWQILAARGAAGIGEGILVAVTALSIAFSRIPAKLSGIFLAVSAPPPLLFAYLLSNHLMPRFGDGAGLGVLAVAGVICAVAAYFIQDDFALTQREGPTKVRWTPLTVVALAGTLFSSAGFGAAWAYVDPLGEHHGLTLGQIGFGVSATIVGQFLISLAIAAIGWRLPMLRTLLAVSTLQIFVPLLLLLTGTPLSFALVLALFGLLWQGAMPFAQSLLVAIDDSRALAALIFPFQLVGLALGPLAASFVAGTSLTYVLMIGAGFYGLTLLTYLIVLLSPDNPKTATLKPV